MKLVKKLTEKGPLLLKPTSMEIFYLNIHCLIVIYLFIILVVQMWNVTLSRPDLFEYTGECCQRLH